MIPEPTTASRNLDLLLDALTFTVPVRMWELRAEAHRITDDQRHARIARHSMVVASLGDVLQWGGKKHSAAFAALSDALALAAYDPDGVTWKGVHWCAATHDSCPRARRGAA